MSMPDALRYMTVPYGSPRPDMKTLDELFTELLLTARFSDKSVANDPVKIRDMLFGGASSAMACLLNGLAPRVFDAQRFHLTLKECVAYFDWRKDGGEKCQREPDDDRVTTLEGEAEVIVFPKKVEDYRDLFYMGAAKCLNNLLDDDAYRINVAKIPFILDELITWTTTHYPKRK